MTFVPYADEAASLRLGQLTVENRLDRLSIHGSVDLTRDRAGLALARELRALLDAAVAALEREEALPEKVTTGEHTDTVRNPFG
ncbi:hypothetical protein EAH89_18160 [Roseomonas nepalensis]|uniref:Uncharacterized protein n=1 Tax=Muricoccus nepalensis TaxID=1854500 RepID=A0A502FSX9_9PROT|nr:hypothetical protein [Roseomonas nepalensis]TPG52489.1 hypothetical protein EAH89_18160 [Roseomonas nepalensis]